jgi:hypothetical protein
MPCQQIQQAAMLPLIRPPPTCHVSGDVRCTNRPIFSRVPGKRHHTSQDDLDPNLKAILNDRSFWMDPSLRLPSFDQTLAKYNDTRTSIFNNSNTDQQMGKKMVARLDERTTLDDPLKAAGNRLRDAVTERSSMRSLEGRSDQVKAIVEE